MPHRKFISYILITGFSLSALTPAFALASVEDESAWSIAMSKASLQLVHNNQGEAEKYYDQALDEARKLGKNTVEEITTLGEKAAIMANRNRLDQAKELRQAQVEAASNTDDPDHLALLIDALEKLNKIKIKRHEVSDPALEARIAKLKAERDNADNNVNYSNYLARLQMIVRKNWRPPLEKNQWQDVECYWRILKDGNTGLLRVTSSSGDEEMDRSALAAVRQASPFESLPEAAAPAVDIGFTFNYNSMKDASHSHQRLFKQDQRNSIDVLQSELTFATKKAGPNDSSLISILVGLANGLEGADQFAEAEKRSNEALSIYESNHLSDPMTKALILDVLCRSLINESKYKELDSAMQQALEVDRADDPLLRQARIQLLGKYVKALMAQGRNSEALDYRKEIKRLNAQ